MRAPLLDQLSEHPLQDLLVAGIVDYNCLFVGIGRVRVALRPVELRDVRRPLGLGTPALFHVGVSN